MQGVVPVGVKAIGDRLREGVPHETVVGFEAIGGVLYVATTLNVYRVEGDNLVRLRWPTGPNRKAQGG